MMKNTLIKVFSVLAVALCMTACGNKGGTSDKSVTTTTSETLTTTTGPVVTTTVATVTNEPEEVVTTTTSSSSEEISTTTEPTSSTSDVDSESTTTVTTTVKTTTTPKASTVASTTTKVTTTKKSSSVVTTTTKKKATTTTTTTKKTTTTAKTTTKTTTTSADNSNDLPDGYKYKFTEEDIEELKQLCKDYAISRGVTWDETLTRANSSWCGDSGFFEYNLFFDMEDARERIKEDVDSWIEVLKETCERNNTEFKGVLGLEVVIQYDEYRNYPKYWQFYILR